MKRADDRIVPRDAVVQEVDQFPRVTVQVVVLAERDGASSTVVLDEMESGGLERRPCRGPGRVDVMELGQTHSAIPPIEQ